MINTIHTKEQQLKNDYFKTGSGSEVILIIGSCRAVPYINYLDHYNKTIGNNRFTICFIDPFNWNFSPIDDHLVNCLDIIPIFETNESMLNLIKSTKVFIHEHYESFGMFNTNKDMDKNIYQFGMAPDIDITIPNFHDVFILVQDYFNIDAEFKKKCIETKGVLTQEMKQEINNKTIANIQRFYKVCSLSSFPEMETYFNDNLEFFRFFCSFNHISKQFSLFIFDLMVKKYLNIELTDVYLREIEKQELYENNKTPLTNYDIELYGFKWGEKVVDFKTHNKL